MIDLDPIRAIADRVEVVGDAILIQADCMVTLPLIDSVNHIVSDPPYEARLHAAKSHEADLRTDGGPSLMAIDFECIDPIRADFVKIASIIAQGWFIVFCTPEGVARWADEINPSSIKYKRACAWVKPDSTPQFNGQCPAMGVEMFVCAWAGQGHSRWNAGGKRGVYTHCVNGPEREGTHPTEKPRRLMAELIRDFTNAGETILDPFMGSGTTGVAAIQLGRKFIGIEKESRYFEIAVKRITDATRQGDLFIETTPPAKPVQEAML